MKWQDIAEYNCTKFIPYLHFCFMMKLVKNWFERKQFGSKVYHQKRNFLLCDIFPWVTFLNCLSSKFSRTQNEFYLIGLTSLKHESNIKIRLHRTCSSDLMALAPVFIFSEDIATEDGYGSCA